MKQAEEQNNLFNELNIEPCNDQCKFCFLNYVDALRSSYIFKDIDHEKIGPIIKMVNHKVKTYEKGELIASSGEMCNNLMIIVKGAAIGEMMDFQGKSLQVEELSAPDTIGSVFLFGDDNELPLDIIATQETKIFLIPKDNLMSLFCQDEIILKNYLNIISNRGQRLTKKIRLLGMQTIRGKIAHFLLEQMKKEKGLSFTIKKSQNELSNMFGVSRPSLARVIREMHNDGIITAEGRNFSIIDKRALSALLK